MSPSPTSGSYSIAHAAPYALYSLNTAAHDHLGETWAGDNGVYVHSAGGDGLRVCTTGDRTSRADDSPLHHGLEVGNAQHDGVHVRQAGRDGVDIYSAAELGVYANTTAADHEWGLYTPDKIYAGTALASAGPLIFVAQNGDAGELKLGDVVAGIGLAAPFADAPDPVPLVGLADGESGAGVIGAARSRFVAQEEMEEIDQATDLAKKMGGEYRPPMQ